MERMRIRIAAALALVVVLTAGVAAARTPDDPGFALQWGLDQIGAPTAWDTGDGAGMTIAIVDSGADLDHEDLRFPDGRPRIVGSVSCVGSGGDPNGCKGSAQDDNGHGTHVAGIAAAAAGNGKGVAGAAPGAKLLIVKALRQSCRVPGVASTCAATGTAADVEAGIRWAADRGATVINLSIGDETQTQSVLGPAFAEALRYAWSKGAIPVVAAGNDMILSSGFSDEPAVVVSATTRDRKAASYSFGVGRAQWGIAAPGGEAETDDTKACGSAGPPNGILSTFFDPERTVRYACQAGTSMAAPHVAGALAILRGLGLQPQQAIERLLATAADAGAPGRDEVFGAGIVDIAAAVEGLGVQGASATPTQAPTTAGGSPGPSGSGGPGATVPATPATTAVDAPDGTPPTIDGTTPPPGGVDGGQVGVAPDGPEVALDLDAASDGRGQRDDQTDDGADADAALIALAVAALAAVGAGNGWWWRTSRRRG